MKTFNWVFMAALIVAFITCSKNQPKALEEEVSQELQSRGEFNQNDSADDDVSAIIKDWKDNILIEGDANEMPKDENEGAASDTISSDTIPADTIPQKKLFN